MLIKGQKLESVLNECVLITVDIIGPPELQENISKDPCSYVEQLETSLVDSFLQAESLKSQLLRIKRAFDDPAEGKASAYSSDTAMTSPG